MAGQPEEFIQQGPCKPQPLVPVPSTVEPSWTGVHLAPLRVLPGRRRVGSQHRPAAIPALCWEGLGFQRFGFDTVITGQGGNTRGEKPGCLEPALCAGPHRSAVPGPSPVSRPILTVLAFSVRDGDREQSDLACVGKGPSQRAAVLDQAPG